MTDNIITDPAAGHMLDPDLGAQIEGDLIAMLDEWHSLPEVWDNELDAQIHRWYANPPKVWPKRPYFSPSAANACLRELYMKATGAKRDSQRRQPHQGRWTRIGTAIGDTIQRDLLFIEKHFEAKTGNKPRFVLERNERGEPMFEDFAKRNQRIDHDGRTFYLYGTPDGILRYTTDDGEVLRVGLEIKSKQTTAAQTSEYSMRQPKEDHARQVVAYSAMFPDGNGKPLDHYVILYVNAAKKAWEFGEGEYEKNPDIRAFYRRITKADRVELYDKFCAILAAVDEGVPPALDLWRWNFNGYKTACAKSLTDGEVDGLRAQVSAMLKSRLPEWKKRGHVDALAFIERVHEEEEE